VTVAGGGNASVPFLYDAPAVTGVSVAAAAADANVVIQVTGTNIGLRNSVTSPDPVVYIGDGVCFQPLLLNSTTVQCTALASPVGAYLVTGTWRACCCCCCCCWVVRDAVQEVCCCVGPRAVSLNGQNGTSTTILHRLCGVGKFGLPGTTCGDCPPVRVSRHQPRCCCSFENAYRCRPLPLLRSERGVRGAVPAAPAQAGLLRRVHDEICELRARGRVPWCQRQRRGFCVFNPCRVGRPQV
jgi:hypothetical protein